MGRIFHFPHWLASSSLQHSHYRATVWFITAGRCVFQVHASVAVAIVTILEISTGRRDSALIQVATRRSFGEWSQQTPTVKQCHRCLIPTGIQENRFTGRQSHACICGADGVPTRGMMNAAAWPGVLSANLIYSHWCKVFLPRDAMRKRSTSCRPVSVRLSVCHTTLVYCIQTA